MGNLWLLICFTSVLVTVVSARPMLPRKKHRNAPIKLFFNHPLELRNRYETPRQRENIGVRRTESNLRVPIYIITSKDDEDILPYEDIFRVKQEAQLPYEVILPKHQEKKPDKQRLSADYEAKLPYEVISSKSEEVSGEHRGLSGYQNKLPHKISSSKKELLPFKNTVSSENENEKDILAYETAVFGKKLPYETIASHYKTKKLPYVDLLKTLITILSKNGSKELLDENKNTGTYKTEKLPHKTPILSHRGKKIPYENKIESNNENKRLINERLFDENGMLYLTKPKNIAEGKLNRDMNKLVARTLDLFSKGSESSSDNFVPLENRNVLRLREEPNDKTIRSFKPNIEYELSDLVI